VNTSQLWRVSEFLEQDKLGCLRAFVLAIPTVVSALPHLFIHLASGYSGYGSNVKSSKRPAAYHYLPQPPTYPSLFLGGYWGLNSGPHACLAALPLLPLCQPFFVMVIFKVGSRNLFALGWLQTEILLISASWVARITGVPLAPGLFLRGSCLGTQDSPASVFQMLKLQARTTMPSRNLLLLHLWLFSLKLCSIYSFSCLVWFVYFHYPSCTKIELMSSSPASPQYLLWYRVYSWGSILTLVKYKWDYKNRFGNQALILALTPPTSSYVHSLGLTLLSYEMDLSGLLSRCVTRWK
jgi:hypothetical protein